MDLNYYYTETEKIKNNIIRIETSKKILELFPFLPHIEETQRKQSLLKSSLFSARIEGNTLNINDIRDTTYINTHDRQQQEIINILNALHWIYSQRPPSRISIPLICQLHKKVMHNLTDEFGKLRIEPSAIFNMARIAIYVTPPPSQITHLLTLLINNTKTKKTHIVIKTAIMHFTFEKIHPFLDGNGRVGRLLSTLQLKSSGYDFRGISVLEQYLSNNRQIYYETLANTRKDITEFIEFFTSAIAESSENVVNILKQKTEEKDEDILLPRRKEILTIIREHRLVSFDFLKRRFLKIPDSSLHYDLKMLLQAGFIKKLGKTRGSLYALKGN